MSDDKDNSLIRGSIGETLKVEELNRRSSELVQKYYFTAENIFVETQDEKYKLVIK